MKHIATFAAGCFWHVQFIFEHLPGVINTQAGYTGGHTPNPTYEDVCSHTTGHAEAVEVEFDPEQISYSDLLEQFWKLHDPTQLNKQGPDIGTQYRSAIFYHTPEQKLLAETSRHELEEKHVFDKPIATEIVPVKEFYVAEEYHQHYVNKHGGIDTCPSP